MPEQMNYDELLKIISEEVKCEFGKGNVANYIPALAKISPKKFGVAIKTNNKESFYYGDAEENFSIQSISKVFSLTLAIQLEGDAIWDRIGKEPSGNPFNSLVQLEYENGIPRNPFINAGAIVMCDILISNLKNPKIDLLNFVRTLADDDKIEYDLEVAKSEKNTGDRNVALAHFMKSYKNLNNDVEEVLDLYFHQCSLSMSCKDICRAFVFLSNEGISPFTNEQIINYRQTKRINSLMVTSGMYDAAGDFAYRVGLPGKSGVGGGIVAIIPRELCISVWSPELNQSGNSLVGTKALELFTTYTRKSIF